MGQAEISELERLANKAELVAPIVYNNPERNREQFYDFVRRYGDSIGVSIENRTITFFEDYVNYWQQLNLWLRDDSGTPYDTALSIFENLLGLVLGPIMYPLLGGGASIQNGGVIITIRIANYLGILPRFASTKTHEYMHAYHAIMARDFRDRGLIEIDGYHDVDHTEPSPMIKVPTQDTLKKFERRIIKQIIRTICR